VRRRGSTLLTLAAAVSLAACGGHWIPEATEADATRGAARWPGTTVADLNHGRTLLLSHCGNCHLPPSPSAHTSDEWPGEVAHMRERSGLSVPDAALVERYLAVFASDQTTPPR
jgi:cytochrome c5